MPVEIIPAPVEPDKPKPGGPIQSTSGRVISNPPLQWVVVYAPDGSPHRCSPVDAREILAAGNGYTVAPPEVKADEPEPEQQSVNGDVAETDASARASAGGEDRPHRRQGRRR